MSAVPTLSQEEESTTPAMLVVDPAGVEELPQHFNVATEAGSSSAGSSPAAQHNGEAAAAIELEAPPPKRICTSSTRPVIPSYLDMPATSLWITKIKGKNAFSSPIISVYTPNGIPRFALYTKDELRQKIPFSLDLEPQQNVPSFLFGTPDPSKTTEGLDLCINVTKAQEDYIEAIEAWVRSEALKNSKDWFGKQYNNMADINAMFTSALKRDSDNKYQTKVRAKLVLSGVEQYLTKIAFVKTDGVPLKGAGWNFVKPLLGSKNWRNCEARAILELRSLWIVNKKFGLRLSYTDLLIMEEADTTACADFPELEL